MCERQCTGVQIVKFGIGFFGAFSVCTPCDRSRVTRYWNEVQCKWTAEAQSLATPEAAQRERKENEFEFEFAPLSTDSFPDAWQGGLLNFWRHPNSVSRQPGIARNFLHFTYDPLLTVASGLQPFLGSSWQVGCFLANKSLMSKRSLSRSPTNERSLRRGWEANSSDVLC